MRAVAGLWLAALLCLSCTSCSGKKIWVEQVEVDDDALKESPELAWTKETAEAELLAQLKKAHFVIVPEGETAPDRAAKLKLSFSIAEPETEGTDGVESSDGVEVGAQLEVRLKGDPERRTVSASARRTVNGEGLDERRQALQGAAKSALDKIAADAFALVKATALSDDELVRQLESKSLADKHAAVRILAERRNKAAVQPLLEQLKLDDDDLVRQAIGGLVEIGDPRAVPGLIEASHGKNEIFQREVVFAVGAIGGEEAEAYLFTVSSGTENPVLRGSAEQALKEMKARESKDGGKE